MALAGELRGTADVRVERRFQAQAVSTGSTSICAVDLEGRIWCQGGWGTGIAYPSSDATEVQPLLEPVHGTDRYTAVGSNSFFACGLATGGQVLCWGYQPVGDQLSAGVPTAIAPGITFDTLSIQGWMGCGLADQTAYCWGVPVTGVKPINTTGLARWCRSTCNSTMRADGPRKETSYAGMGGFANFDGRLFSSPPAGAPPSMTSSTVAATCGLDAAGRGWCWGANESGQLGNGTTVNSAEAVQVAGGRRFTGCPPPLMAAVEECAESPSGASCSAGVRASDQRPLPFLLARGADASDSLSIGVSVAAAALAACGNEPSGPGDTTPVTAVAITDVPARCSYASA